jgi:hypothetical protein
MAAFAQQLRRKLYPADDGAVMRRVMVIRNHCLRSFAIGYVATHWLRLGRTR